MDADELKAQIKALSFGALQPVLDQLLPGVRGLAGPLRCRGTGWATVIATTGGVMRVSGVALRGKERVPWSMILKVLERPRGMPALPRDDFRDWRREASFYQSSVADALGPGLRAPRLLGHVTSRDRIWLWLEEVKERPPRPWDLSRYGAAARHLGQFAAQQRSARPRPDWMARGLHRQLMGLTEMMEAQVEEVPWTHPLVRRALPASTPARLRRLLKRVPSLVQRLESLPQTLVHHDAFRANLLADDGRAGARTVLLDWALVGDGGVGADLGGLLSGNALYGKTRASQLPALMRTVAEGYATGLHEEGWNGVARDAEAGLRAAAAMRLAFLLAMTIGLLVRPGGQVWQRNCGRSPGRSARGWGQGIDFLFQLAEAA